MHQRKKNMGKKNMYYFWGFFGVASWKFEIKIIMLDD
jgi:hypothetical protein